MLGSIPIGDGEIILILALVLILLGADKLPRIARRLMGGDDARDAGRSFGGIYGKRAAQAITPKNQVAELYDPAAFRRKLQRPSSRIMRFLMRVWRRIVKWIGWT